LPGGRPAAFRVLGGWVVEFSVCVFNYLLADVPCMAYRDCGGVEAVLLFGHQQVELSVESVVGKLRDLGFRV